MLKNEYSGTRRKRSYIPQFKVRLAELIQQYPVLYQKSIPWEQKHESPTECWTKIAQTMAREFEMPGSTKTIVSELIYLWRNLRDQLRHHRKLAERKSGQTGEDPYDHIRRWEFFEALSFLNEEMERETTPGAAGKVAKVPIRDILNSMPNPESEDEGGDEPEHLFSLNDILMGNYKDLDESKISPSNTSSFEMPESSDAASLLKEWGGEENELKPLFVKNDDPPTPQHQPMVPKKKARMSMPSFRDDSPLAAPAIEKRDDDPAIIQLIREKYKSYQGQSKGLAEEFENELLALIVTFNKKSSASSS
ncbi:unnamed protein product, partial [Mesorhabditis spiculigera]